jgi:hypothetical protein
VHLVEILLPVADNEGQPFNAQKYVWSGKSWIFRMKQRGRKSKEALSAVVLLPGVVPGQRPEPPAELTEEQAATWRAIAGRQPADWFEGASLALLAQLVRHISIAKMLGTILAAIDPATVVGDKEFRRLERLRSMHDAEGRAINSLMRTMRITHQARYHQTAAHVAARNVRPGPKPWETS